jgi:hypothetical protein
MVTIVLHISNNNKVIVTLQLAIAMAVQDKTTHQKTFGSNMATTQNIDSNNKTIVTMQLANATAM